jgi:hypothetical protein
VSVDAAGAAVRRDGGRLKLLILRLTPRGLERPRLLTQRPRAISWSSASLIDVAGWAHAEWVRIHPFANGNGRTARIWANVILMRYGIEPVVRLRPRPDNGYGDAGAKAMHGDWVPTADCFRALVMQAYQLRGPPGKIHYPALVKANAAQ